ncbi:MAG TPA: phosphohydrolase [Deltaproteobacteria bacterium]|nr:phosphohydrolase [Deltaproteobacteria bacterium]
MFNEKEKLKEIINLGLEVAQVKDIDLLLEHILTRARRFVNADAGSIYIIEDDKLKFKYTQNDTLQKRLPSGKKLIYSTFSVPINNKSIAGYVALTGETLNMPDAYTLPEGVPYSFDKSYDRISKYRTQSMLTLPLKNNRGDIIGVLQLINAKSKDNRIIPFLKEDEPLIMHLANNAAIAIERAQMTRTIILRMIKMAELRDPQETGAHVNRVGSFAVEIYDAWATKRGIPQEQIDKNKDVLRMAAILHDVGKVAISDTILKKPGKLDNEEYEVMKHHTYLGARLFNESKSDFDEAAYIVALNHHERWDSNGYPGYINVMTGKTIPGYETADGRAKGKKGEEIPPFGRVVALADVYDALSSRRSYKDRWDEVKILETIEKERGKHFDPEMVDVFFNILDVIRSIAERYPDE